MFHVLHLDNILTGMKSSSRPYEMDNIIMFRKERLMTSLVFCWGTSTQLTPTIRPNTRAEPRDPTPVGSHVHWGPRPHVISSLLRAFPSRNLENGIN